jgi:hypothetical protein
VLFTFPNLGSHCWLPVGKKVNPNYPNLGANSTVSVSKLFKQGSR